MEVVCSFQLVRDAVNSNSDAMHQNHIVKCNCNRMNLMIFEVMSKPGVSSIK